MPSRDEALRELQSKFIADATPWREGRKKLVDRDSVIVNEVREYFGDVIQMLLAATGEALTLDMSDRMLDLVNQSTRLHIVIRQEDFRFFKFDQLEINIFFDANSVYVNGKPPMGREGRYFYPDINEVLTNHFSLARATSVYASDFGAVRGT